MGETVKVSWGNVYEDKRSIYCEVDRLIGVTATARTLVRMRELDVLMGCIDRLRSQATHLSSEEYLERLECISKRLERL
jgi:hypothetical protein